MDKLAGEGRRRYGGSWETRQRLDEAGSRLVEKRDGDTARSWRRSNEEQ